MNRQMRYELLRRFEPILRFTRGEDFLPIAVEPYVRNCSLWTQRPEEKPACLVAQGELSLEGLAETETGGFGTVSYLKFIEPLNIAQLATYKLEHGRKKRRSRDVFRAGRGRLARVGYLPRFADALFSLTLLARGRVPGDTAAAAVMAYGRMTAGERRHCYYGRVVRENGWVVLQYWFFYPFNNWRSGFFGVNDHEADWEMVCVYVSEGEDGDFVPEWAAYAAHDFSGDDLRRRWDDPELEKVGEHPVVYAGAGSHASYYRPGEYVAEIELPFLSRPARGVENLRKFWRRALRQYYQGRGGEPRGDRRPALSVPFVDYARGDGVEIGPGAKRSWDGAQLLDPVPDWVSGYRGLWGLYAQDPVSGEDAPAGPMYERDGTVRRAWHDPVGWAGLDKVPPVREALGRVRERRREIEGRCREAEASVEERSRELTGLNVEAEAMRGRPHLEERFRAQEEEIEAVAGELAQTRSRLASDRALLEELEGEEERLQAGERGSPRAHIRQAHHPASETNLRFDRLAEAWAAVSIGLTMIAFIALILFAEDYLVFGLAALVSLFVFVESGFRRRLMELTTSVTIGLTIVASLILLYEFFWQVVVAAVLAAGAYILWENLRELWT